MNKKIAKKDENKQDEVAKIERIYYPKKSVIITPRDVIIEDFLERVGWANYEQIRQYLSLNNYELTSEALRSRLSRLAKFGRLRSTRSIESTYFALSKESKRENELVNALRHDRLAHENYLINMVLSCDKRFINRFKFPREIRAEIEVGKKSGPIPDLVFINKFGDDYVHIEYERTAKSNVDIKESIFNWLRSEKRNKFDASIMVICESCAIKDKYKRVINDLELVTEVYENQALKLDFSEMIEGKNGAKIVSYSMSLLVILKDEFSVKLFLDFDNK